VALVTVKSLYGFSHKEFIFPVELISIGLTQLAQGMAKLRYIVKGIGVVSCVYVNPKVEIFWVIHYRILILIYMVKPR
jgi:hypothetical protein